MDYLIDNADKFQKGNEWKRPYWTVYGTENPKGKVKDFLNKSGAFLIHNNGFDDMMARLALALNVKIPTEGDYQEQAEKQYNKLQDAFAKVQEGSKTSPGVGMKDSSTTPDDNPKDTSIPPRKGNAPPQDLPETETASPPQSDQDTSDSTLYLRALVLHNDKHYKESLALLQELIQNNPNNARYHNSCGVTLHEMGRYEEALAEKQKALELEPDNARYHDSCGMTLYAMELYKEAVAAFKKAIELNPKNAIYYSNLSQTYKKMGLEKEATQAEEKAKQLQGNPSTG